MSKIQWFPGHMAKAIREIREKRHEIDVIIEVLDARAPLASRNPILDEIFPTKPKLLVLNKSDLADPIATKKWLQFFKNKNITAINTNALSQKEIYKIENKALSLAKEQNKNKKTIIKKNIVKAVVFGIPNTGKSSIINHLAKKNKAQTGYHPGKTKKQTWLSASPNFFIMDTPGILLPKFDNPEQSYALAALNCIKKTHYQNDEIVIFLISFFKINYAYPFAKKYNIEMPFPSNQAIIDQIGIKRGCLSQGNELDYERIYELILKDFREGKIGKISLEEAS
ncbi:ribosome biogenesis GTPase YlqF [Candidatus Margulisiibacteriota bacterium]